MLPEKKYWNNMQHVNKGGNIANPASTKTSKVISGPPYSEKVHSRYQRMERWKDQRRKRGRKKVLWIFPEDFFF